MVESLKQRKKRLKVLGKRPRKFRISQYEMMYLVVMNMTPGTRIKFIVEHPKGLDRLLRSRGLPEDVHLRVKNGGVIATKEPKTEYWREKV